MRWKRRRFVRDRLDAHGYRDMLGQLDGVKVLLEVDAQVLDVVYCAIE